MINDDPLALVTLMPLIGNPVELQQWTGLGRRRFFLHRAGNSTILFLAHCSDAFSDAFKGCKRFPLFAVENAVEESPGVGRKVIVRITPYAAHEAW